MSIGGSGALPQIKEAIIKVVVQERIGDLLIRNGFTEDSARAIEAAAKTAYNIQSLPPSSFAVAEGALDTSGAYRAAQLSIYENNQYVGAVALAEAGGYQIGAQPAVPPGLLDAGAGSVDMPVRYNLSDGVYSAGVRNNVPEPVIREAILLLGKLTDLKAPLPAKEHFRVLYAPRFSRQIETLRQGLLCRPDRAVGRGGLLFLPVARRRIPLLRSASRQRRRSRADQRRGHFRADQGRARHLDVRHALPSDSAHCAPARRH